MWDQRPGRCFVNKFSAPQIRLTTTGCVAMVSFLGPLFVGQPIHAAGGPFTAQQAEDGHTKYNSHCAQCHRPNLQGGTGPALTGDAFKGKWAGKPVADLRTYNQTKMPPNAPGTLPDDQIDPITAYILSKNGVPPGDTPLGKDTASAQIPK